MPFIQSGTLKPSLTWRHFIPAVGPRVIQRLGRVHIPHLIKPRLAGLDELEGSQLTGHHRNQCKVGHTHTACWVVPGLAGGRRLAAHVEPICQAIFQSQNLNRQPTVPDQSAELKVLKGPFEEEINRPEWKKTCFISPL